MDSTEYRHSKEIPSEVWDKSKCPTQFRPRLSKYASIADDACWAVRDEMVAAGGSELITQGVVCVDSVSGNAMAIWFPEALPERLYIASYMIEFAFMHDGEWSIESGIFN
jgi:dolasta-1(15),8-diene / delta-araneosene synthase